MALFDGLPLENHTWLDGRIIVDDVDDWSDETLASERFHSTAMSSLIIHGELDRNEASLNRPIYIRPIIKPNPADFRTPKEERIPENITPVDIVNSAVRRLYEEINGEQPVAPTVKIINLSVCDRMRQYYRYPSPWARMIDFLSWKYNVLFIISAGNHTSELKTDIPISDVVSFISDNTKVQEQIFKCIYNDGRNRRLFSPSEAINALTIGSLHGDSSNPIARPDIIDPFENNSCVSSFSAQGLGFRRSVKPDVIMPGGRQIYRDNVVGDNGNIVLNCPSYVIAPGQRVATPSNVQGQNDATIYSRGTSNAAALTTRLAAQINENLNDIRTERNGELLTDNCISSLIKAFIVHGSSWGVPGQTVRNLLDVDEKNTITRFLGYGVVDSSVLFDCNDERVTIIGCGSIHEDEAHRYRIPLPSSLVGMRIQKRLTCTLAWISPINPAHQGYRNAELWFEPWGETNSDNNAMDLLRLSRLETDNRTSKRGTVQHEIFIGEQAAAYNPDDVFHVQINCRADAGKLSTAVNYGLVITLEVAPEQGVQIYQEIRDRILLPVTIDTMT